MVKHMLSLDTIFWLMIIILPILASIGVKSTFQKYSNVNNANNLTAEQVARYILDSNGLHYIKIEHVTGNLSDHYDPKELTVRLSDSTLHQTSIAAISVAAHECGHACQHAKNYMPIKIRTAIVPITNICSRTWTWVFLAGVLFSDKFPNLINISILMFSMVVLFQLVTLPAELNASHRAIQTMEQSHILTQTELPYARKVLIAAAMTYVTSLTASVLQLIRLLSRRK